MRQVTDGIYYLLVDEQDRPGRPADVRYVRTAYKITDRTGVEEAARLSISFDPASENLVLHHARIWRDGDAQDRLAQANIQILRQEKELDKGIVDGRKTVHLELKDVRVGDIVDYAYSSQGADPVLAGAFQSDNSFSWSTPVAVTRYRLLWPHGQPIAFKPFGGAPAPRIRPAGDRDEYLWQTLDPEPVQKEDDVPDWMDQWGRVVVSSKTSWGQVVAWSLPLYRQDPALTPAWTAKTDAIAAKYPDPKDRVTEALRLVQDDVRYVSLSMGSGSFRPRPPAEVIRSGFGDCKDKALLLVTILRRLGVNAVPALTDTANGPALPDAVPGVNDFNHAIVRIELGGKPYWVDPTLSQQGGRFPGLGGLHVAWALPSRPGQAGLEAVPTPSAQSPTADVTERYEAPARPGQDLTLEVTSLFRGEDAENLRSDLASRSPAEIEKKYLEFYAEMYPGLRRLRPLEVRDDRDANLLTVREAYQLPATALAAGGLARSFPIKASTLNSYKTRKAGERRLPLWVRSPVNQRHRIVLVTPGRKPPAPDAVDLRGKTFHFTRGAQRNGDTLIITEALIGLREVVPASEVEAFRKDVETLNDATYATLDLTSNSGGTTGGVSRPLALAVIALALLLLFPAVLGLRSALSADKAYAADGQFYPVTPAKFLLMSAATCGLYASFWRWKCWRWAKAHDGQDIQPFWRTVFSVFWLWPLFSEANGRLTARRLPAALGISAAVLFFAWSVGDRILSRLHLEPTWLEVSSLGVFLCNLPAVIAVHRLNGPDSPVTLGNSRATWHTAVAVGVGVLFWTLVVIGLAL